MTAVLCDYCGRQAPLVTGAKVYPHRPDLHARRFYACDPCGAWVGCHQGTTKPLGRLANKELRDAKMAAHAAFDPIWKERFERLSQERPTYRKHHARGGRYVELASALGIPVEKCHIGMFDVELCKRTVEICRSGSLSR